MKPTGGPFGPIPTFAKEIRKMVAIKKLPDSATLRRLRAQGFTQRDIAQTYGVSDSAVWKALMRAGYTEAQPTYKDLLPWDIADEHKTTAVMDKFRAINKQKSGKPLRPEEETLLNRWLHDLEVNGLVVNYHPSAPANSASSKGGFYYVPKSDEDDWIIRRPQTPS